MEFDQFLGFLKGLGFSSFSRVVLLVKNVCLLGSFCEEEKKRVFLGYQTADDFFFF